MMEITTLVEKQRSFFDTGATLSVEYRKKALDTLLDQIKAHEDEIYAALKADLGKGEFESYMCEVALTISELKYQRSHIARFSKPQRVYTPLAHFAGHSFRQPSPLGVCLVMSPWNYPFMLAMEPLIGAIAAGNCAVVKPGNYAQNTCKVISQIISAAFAPEYVCAVLGGREENAALLDQKFDCIFFTGSVGVGKLVLEKAAANLTPVTLELGGKSPCIVDKTADVKIAARRIVFGKYLNAGQTCVAPDYLFVHEDIKQALVDEIKLQIEKQYDGGASCEHLGKIINRKHFDRVKALIDGEEIICGGTYDKEALKIAPTVLDKITPQAPVMQEEIFGPVLPVIAYSDINDVIKYVRANPKPLALYLFTKDKTVEQRVLTECQFGGGCINDVVVHLATSYTPFGGVGESGMGSYHGKKSFETFSHYKSIHSKACWIDLPIRYQPANELKKKLLKIFIK